MSSRSADGQHHCNLVRILHIYMARLPRSCSDTTNPSPCHDCVIKWKHFPRYWPFVRETHRSPVNSPHKGQWRGALMFPLINAWTNGWVNNRDAGDLRRHRPHHDVTVIFIVNSDIHSMFTAHYCLVYRYNHDILDMLPLNIPLCIYDDNFYI